MNMDTILGCRDISKVYGEGSLAEPVLNDVSFSLERGQTCALLGPSGSGKTTLLSILGCLLSPTTGDLQIDGRIVKLGSVGELAEIRRNSIGFVFQHAQLLPFLTMGDNLRVVGRNAGIGESDLSRRIADLAGRLGIESLLVKKPHMASGGQRQRVAIARALLHSPPIVLADEPTASLDWAVGEVVIKMLTDQVRSENALLLTVTHDTRLLGYFDRIFHIEGGRLVER